MRTYNAENKRFPGGQEERIEVPGTGLDEIKGLKSWESVTPISKEMVYQFQKHSLRVHREAIQVLVGKTSPPRFLEEAAWGILTSPREDANHP